MTPEGDEVDDSGLDGSGVDEVFRVAGLAADVDVLVDRWGVPHVYAASRLDAFVAQGFQAARDRLFQIDLWRRRGLGLLAEAFGPAHLAQDRATRLFLYRGDMRAEWLAYGTGTRDVVTAFVAGVNAFVDWAMEAPEERLPPEFAVLGHRPARWSPQDVVRIRTHGLLYNAEQELARALTVRDLGPEAEELRSVREPAGPLAEPEPGLYASLCDEVLDVHRLAFAPVTFGTGDFGTGDVGRGTTAEPSTPSGSNNWVIAGSRTTTGRPVLANDPHRALLTALPTVLILWAACLEVVGGGDPAGSVGGAVAVAPAR